MSFWARVVSLCVSALIILYILRTIRTRKMREEYVILWLFTAIGTAILVFFENFSVWLAGLIGAENDVVTVTFFAFAYILAILVHYSLRISEMMYNIRDLNQEIAMLKSELDRLRKDKGV